MLEFGSFVNILQNYLYPNHPLIENTSIPYIPQKRDITLSWIEHENMTKKWKKDV